MAGTPPEPGEDSRVWGATRTLERVPGDESRGQGRLEVHSGRSNPGPHDLAPPSPFREHGEDHDQGAVAGGLSLLGGATFAGFIALDSAPL